MPDGPGLTLGNSTLAFLPILMLMSTILVLRWSAPRAGAVAWMVAAAVALLFFGTDATALGIGTAKGLSLSLFVLSIIWTSVLLYNVVDHLDGITVIGSTMTRLVQDPLARALVVGWAFSGFMQGVAGFGVPVAVVAPLMIFMGFSPAKAAAIVLVGHAWAVTFGSLGSSYYTIQLVTDIPGKEIGPHMALLFILPIVASGFAVAHLQGGMNSVRRGAATILIMGTVMGLTVWLMATVGAPQIASIVSGLMGGIVGWVLSRTPLQGQAPKQAPKFNYSLATDRSRVNFHLAVLPYYLILFFSVLSQVPVIKEIGASLQWGLSYPPTETTLGFAVPEQDNYARIKLLSHPAPLILLSLIVTYLTYSLIGRWKTQTGAIALRRTYNQCVSTSVGIATMVMMALVMTDTGMTALLGRIIANGTGAFFPIFSPYIGVIGTFMTGSNTNSNVMFGALQLQTATALDISIVTIASIQSIGGSLGSAIAPAKVLVGTSIVGLSGQESQVMRRTIPYCLGIVFLVGIQALVVTRIF